jgi:hypothetical protein
MDNRELALTDDFSVTVLTDDVDHEAKVRLLQRPQPLFEPANRTAVAIWNSQFCWECIALCHMWCLSTTASS